jgi:trk system potassium uptake protein TrkH
MQFVGGVGLVLIVAGALSDRYNLKLYFAEGHNDKLMPNLGKSAKLIFQFISAISLWARSRLWLAGMPAFDAFCHSTAALATGGFGTRSTSFFYFQAGRRWPVALMDGISCRSIRSRSKSSAIVLMLLGATNFVLHTFF